jgi:GNAT superfamily N-acetyltransferase
MIVTITYLEMLSPSDLTPKRTPDERFRICEILPPRWEFNRSSYVAAGKDWSWTDKLGWTDAQWKAYAESPNMRTFGAYLGAAQAGYYELNQDESLDIEIAYFGLLPEFLGLGFGGAMLTHALQTAWMMQPQRVWVHTCSLDHPAALKNYLARGMRIYKEENKKA